MLLGYMNPVYGLAGLEKKYDEELMGRDTGVSKYLFFSKDTEEKVGNGLRTTLDSKLQNESF